MPIEIRSPVKIHTPRTTMPMPMQMPRMAKIQRLANILSLYTLCKLFMFFFLIVQGQNASIGTQTRAMKRKRSEINMKPNNSMSPKKVQNKTHSRARTRTRKLTLAQAIENGSPSNEFVTDEVVLVTIPGFCAWPARIVGILKETLMVEFFGTSQINPVRINAVTRFKLIDVIPLLQRKGFRKSMEELEFALQIPPQFSLFKQ